MRNKLRLLLGIIAAAVRTVSLTNLATNGNFASTSGWTGSGSTFTVSGNEATFVANSVSDTLQQALTVVNAHKYYFQVSIKAASGANITCGISDGLVNGITLSATGTGSYQRISGILTAGRSSAAGITWALVDNRTGSWNAVNAKYLSVIDLTAAFGAGNEPTKDQMDGLMAQFTNNWLNGTQSADYYW